MDTRTIGEKGEVFEAALRANMAKCASVFNIHVGYYLYARILTEM
jgi:hypothetical protein